MKKMLSTSKESTLVKYNAEWSAPARIIEVKDQTVVVQISDQDSKYRQVPKQLVRKVSSEIPESLAALQLDNINRDFA